MRPLFLLIPVAFTLACDPVPTPSGEPTTEADADATTASPGTGDAVDNSEETRDVVAQQLSQAVKTRTAMTNTVQNSGTVAVGSVVEDDEAPPPIADDHVIAQWNGGSLTMGELRQQLQGDLAQLEQQYLSQQREAKITFLSTQYDMQSQTIDGLANEALLNIEVAASDYNNVDELIEAEVVSKVPEPTDAEVQEFFLAVQRQLQGATLEEVRPMIIQQLKREAARGVIESYMAELQAKYGFTSHLPFPDLPRIPVTTDGDPYLGSQDGPVEIVVFAEYQCPYCATVTPTLERLVEQYPGKLHVVFRDFPLNFHDRAIPAAIAANCAGEQGNDNYWAMHNLLMSDQRNLTDKNFKKWAKDIGLEMGAFQSCLSDPEVEAEVDADYKDGMAAGVGGTPTVFINGLKLTAGPSYDAMKQMIDRELAEG